MDAQSELALIRSAQAGDRDAMGQLLANLRPLALHIATKGGRLWGDCVDDLLQECAIATIDALRRFNPERGRRLSSFLERRLRGCVADWWRDQLPTGAQRTYQAAYGRRTHSIFNTPPDERSGTWEVDGRPDEDWRTVDEEDEWEALLRTFSQESDRQILTWRFRHGLRQREIASRLGLSESRISQRLTQLLRILHGRCERGVWSHIPPKSRGRGMRTRLPLLERNGRSTRSARTAGATGQPERQGSPAPAAAAAMDAA